MRDVLRFGLLLPALVFAWLIIATGVGVAASFRDVSQLRALARTPHATLAAPRRGPAIYSGRVYAATPRKTPHGTQAAAYWWWVMINSPERSKRDWTVCRGAASDHLVLEADGKRVAANLFDDRKGVSLVANDRSEAPDRMTVDLGPTQLLTDSTLPASLARCATGKGVLVPNREYHERAIAEGAQAEILACFDGKELVACRQKVGGILAIPTLSVDIAHRARTIRWPIRIATLICALPLFVLGITAGRLRKRRHAREARPGDGQ